MNQPIEWDKLEFAVELQRHSFTVETAKLIRCQQELCDRLAENEAEA